MMSNEGLRIKIFADGADLKTIERLSKDPRISGFTTNPTLMRKAGVPDYRGFAKAVLRAVPELPVSFEVFSDDAPEMERQAREIASWGANVYVKIPVTNTQGEFMGPLISRLAGSGVQVNVTAVFTPKQVEQIVACLDGNTASIVSVFAGRIGDSGRDPCPIMAECLKILSGDPRAELLWASPREVLNVRQADEIGCHIITVTNDILSKLSSLDKDLDEFSLETVRMFRDDAVKAGYTLDAP